MTPTEIVAWHESGHACAYRHFGDRIQSIALFNSGGGLALGTCRVSQNTPYHEALRSLSGPAAEFAVSGSIGKAAVWAGYHHSCPTNALLGFKLPQRSIRPDMAASE
jgi:hypothetical protein